MANKQSVPDMRLGGVNLLKTVSARPAPIAKRIYGGNPDLDLAIGVADLSSDVLAVRKKFDEENMRLETDEVLHNYRTLMKKAGSVDEINMLEKSAEDDLCSRFNERFNGKEFWGEYGDKILENNRADVAKIREQKNVEFGQISFDEMLAKQQNMLAKSTAEKGEKLISFGVAEIEKSPYLSDEEKGKYKAGYLERGILNLALNDAEGAIKLAQKYLPQNETIGEKISRTKELVLEAQENVIKSQKRDAEIDLYSTAFNLWNAKERGEINAAEYFVLTSEYEPEILFGGKAKDLEMPLYEAYQIFKKINAGEKVTADEVKVAQDGFVGAYENHVISLDEADELNAQLMMAVQDKNLSPMMFDKDIDALVDEAFGDDDSVDREQKAAFAFDVYEDYYMKKMALADEFVKNGGTMTAFVERKFRKQALNEMREELQLEDKSLRANSGTAPKYLFNYHDSHEFVNADMKPGDDLSFDEKDDTINNVMVSLSKHLLEKGNGEDVYEHIYLDVAGKMTTGVGHNIDKIKEFNKVNWYFEEKTAQGNVRRKATEQEIKDGYKIYLKLKAEKKYGKKYAAEYYKDKCNLRIKRQDGINMMKDCIMRDYRALRGNFDGFENYPPALIEAMLDFRYNAGKILISKYPKLREAIAERNLKGIEEHITRSNASPLRNRWAQEKIRSIPEGNGWHR